MKMKMKEQIEQMREQMYTYNCSNRVEMSSKISSSLPLFVSHNTKKMSRTCPLTAGDLSVARTYSHAVFKSHRMT